MTGKLPCPLVVVVQQCGAGCGHIANAGRMISDALFIPWHARRTATYSALPPPPPGPRPVYSFVASRWLLHCINGHQLAVPHRMLLLSRSGTFTVAKALSKRRPCLLVFHSGACRLCKAMKPTIAEVRAVTSRCWRFCLSAVCGDLLLARRGAAGSSTGGRLAGDGADQYGRPA